jgi:hypothetical protein
MFDALAPMPAQIGSSCWKRRYGRTTLSASDRFWSLCRKSHDIERHDQLEHQQAGGSKRSRFISMPRCRLFDADCFPLGHNAHADSLKPYGINDVYLPRTLQRCGWECCRQHEPNFRNYRRHSSSFPNDIGDAHRPLEIG